MPTVVILFFGAELVSLALWPVVLLSRKPPVSMLAWLMGLVLFPGLGPLAYLAVGRERIKRGLARRKHRSDRRIEAHLAAAIPLAGTHPEGLPSVEPELLPLLQLQVRIGVAPLTRGNRVILLGGGAETFERLFADIQRAQSHIHLEYYILEEDALGQRLADLLVERADRGVKVSLLLDALGSFPLGAGFVERLHEHGVEVAWFHPLNPLARRFSLNLRNHRKIAVIDGRTGYLGGINLAARYAGGDGPWADLAIRLEGPAVYSLQRIFLEDWSFSAKVLLARERDFPSLARAPEDNDGLVQIMPSGPDEDWGTLRRVYFAALAIARRQAWLMTPYFLPDESFQAVMESAALRGVDVRVVLPLRSDNRLVDLALRPACADLVAAGVRIFRYTPGMLHGKALLIDGVWMVVGTANMDVRSFRLNFEAGALIHDRAVARDLEAYFLAQMEQAKEATPQDFAAPPWYGRAGESLVRLLNPLL